MAIRNEYYQQIVNSLQKSHNRNSCTLLLEKPLTPDELGQYISALANSAVLESLPYAYALWGINNQNNQIIGTSYKPYEETNNGITIKSWLIQYLSSNVDFSIEPVNNGGNIVLVLEVHSASNTTVQFKGDEYIVLNNKPEKLSNHPDVEKKIWDKLNNPKEFAFEGKPALDNVALEDIIKLLDCNKLFEMLDKPFPANAGYLIDTLLELRFVSEQNTGKYTISNLGAILFARRLTAFKDLSYKAVRVLKYSGPDVTKPAHEQIGGKGYAVGFEGLIKYIMGILPTHEVIDGALRKQVCDYPMLSIRELVANALIHQDFSINGCPIISVFPDRIEITNPGTPLIANDRFIDSPPIARNEALAAAMHKVGICEERGSGYDKVISYIEKYNLPAPQVTTYGKSTKVTLFSYKSFDLLSNEEKIQACYMHTCLNYVQNKITNNTSLRKRFGIKAKESYKVSRIFSDAIQANLIKPRPGTGTKNRSYVPIWAQD